jgi:hypothetical protein
MSKSFTKLFSSITESTIWLEPDQTRLLWLTMLAMADRKGRIEGSVPGLAHRARIAVDACEIGLNTFLSPDPYSRTKEHEGRRIKEIDGGWQLLNYEKYRAMRDEESILESKRNYINNKRAQERQEKSKDVDDVEQCRSLYTQAEAEAEKRVEEEKDISEPSVPPRKPSASVPCPSAEIIRLYHEALPELPGVRVETKSRQKALRTFWVWVLTSKRSDGSRRAETADQALAWIGEYFRRVRQNDFLMGRSGRGDAHANWRPDLEFLLSDKGKKHVIEKTQEAA